MADVALIEDRKPVAFVSLDSHPDLVMIASGPFAGTWHQRNGQYFRASVTHLGPKTTVVHVDPHGVRLA